MLRLLTLLGLVMTTFTATPSRAEPTIHVFGPGGPAPAMKEAGETVGKKSNVKVEIVSGPTGAWLEKAKTEGDVVYSGSEVMMTDFVTAMGGQIADETITPLYLRPAAFLVRPGNPKGIKGLADLLSRDHKVLGRERRRPARPLGGHGRADGRHHQRQGAALKDSRLRSEQRGSPQDLDRAT